MSTLSVILVGLFLLAGSVQAQTPVFVSNSNAVLDITPDVQVGKSAPEIVDPEQISFEDPHKNELRHGYSSQDLWIKFKLKNTGSEALNKVLYMDSPIAGELTLFSPGQNDFPQRSGPSLPLALRARESRLGSFNISLPPQQEQLFYIKRSGHHALNTHLFLSTPEALEKQETLVRSIFFFYIGGILCLVIYNFVIGLFATQKDHLIYSLFAASFGLTAMTLHGVMDTYLFPNTHLVFSNYLMFFSSLALFSATLFVEKFLGIHRNFALGYWGLRVFRWLSLGPMVASFFAPHFRFLFFFGYWIDLSIAGAILFFLFCGIHALTKRNYILAYYFLLSWVVILIGTSIWFTALHGLVPLTPFTQYSLLFANLGEMLVLSLGLAYKIKTLDDEKRAALIAAEEKERYHRLVKVLSHDVANAISGMIFHVEALKETVPATEHVNRIAKATSHLDEILRAVREEELFYSFKAHSEMRPVNLLEACQTAIRYFSWELKEKNIHVQLDISQDLEIRADRSALINQVLANLLSNSIKFTDPGKSIYLHATRAGSEVVLSIRDEGVGIRAEDLQYLFKGKKIFSSKGTLNEKGSGLGSSLIGDYVKIFGGRIEVESVHRSQSEHSGTTVRMIFPKIQ